MKGMFLLLCAACTLLASACSLPGAGEVSIVTPAPVSPRLTVFVDRPTGLAAYRASDGALRWTYDAPSQHFEALNLIYSEHAGLLIAYTFDGQSGHLTLLALNSADGHVRWQEPVAGLTAPDTALTGDYLVQELGNRVNPGFLHVIRLRDGATVRDIPVTVAGLLAVDRTATGVADAGGDGNTAYTCTLDGYLKAYRLGDGRLLWSARISPGPAETGPRCVAYPADGIILCLVTGAGQDANTVVAVRASDGRRLWQKPLYVGSHAGGIEYYFDHATLDIVAYRAADGAMLWRAPEGGVNIASEGDVVAFSRDQLGQDGSLGAVRASDGVELWRYLRPAGRTLGILGVVGGVVFASSTWSGLGGTPTPAGTDMHSYLLALGAHNGQRSWQMPLTGIQFTVGDMN